MFMARLFVLSAVSFVAAVLLFVPDTVTSDASALDHTFPELNEVEVLTSALEKDNGTNDETSALPIQILSTNVYIGPNQYARVPVIRHVLDVRVLEEPPATGLGPEFINKVLNQFPSLEKEGLSYINNETDCDRSKNADESEGAWIAHVMVLIAIQLQVMAGSKVTFGQTQSTGVPGQYHVLYEYEHSEVGLQAGDFAHELILDMLPYQFEQEVGELQSDFEFEKELDHFIEYAEYHHFGPSTGSLVDAAKSRNVPCYRDYYDFIRLGHGKYQRRIDGTCTDRTSHFGVQLASDKAYVNELLRDLGIPVPIQELVYNVSEACDVSNRSIGFPVVVKPLDSNHGNGVSINLTDESQVIQAFDAALAYASTGGEVVVEKFVPGFDHRLLVVNGKLVAAAKKIPGHIVGDGLHTVEELVDSVNKDPRRGHGHSRSLTKLQLDLPAIQLLNKKGYTNHTVLADGEVLFLRSTANLSTGGTSIDVTDDVHPDNRYMAERAVSALGLDIGGVDFITEDIRQSHRDIGGAIVEINSSPGFRMHLDPSEGEPRDVAGPVIDMLFPPGTPVRIPIAAITGTNGKTTTTRMVAHILKSTGDTVGMTTTDGVYSNGQLTHKGDTTGPTGAQLVLNDPMIDCAVLEVARGGIVRSGLGFDKSEVAACLNIASDHLGIDGINSLEELARIKRVVLESATGTAVLNADDPHCIQMADFIGARRISYFTTNPDNEMVREHILQGGQAVVLERGMFGEMITMYDNGGHSLVAWTHQIPATLDGKVTFNVHNAMFATAISYNMGKSLDDIRIGLGTFENSFVDTPGRMNFFREHPFDVLLDYAHNAHGVGALCDAVNRHSVAGRRIISFAVPGDRRDEDIKDYARAVAGTFDRFVCRDDDDIRGREPLEVPMILGTTLLEEGVPDEAIEIVDNEGAAIRMAMEGANIGDLVVVIGSDNLLASWNYIVNFRPDTASRTEEEDSKL